MRATILALAALTLLVSSGIIATVPAASGASITDFIRDINTSWGTPTSPTGASPGDKNLPLTVTLQYDYTSSASSIQGLLTLPNGFTLYDGTNESYSSTPGGVASGSVFQLTFDGIFLSPSLALGVYNFSLSLWAYSDTGIIFEQNSNVTVYVEGRPQLQVSTPAPSLNAGQVDEVPLLVTNSGSGNATELSLTVTAAGVSVLTPLLEIQSLAANKSAPLNVEVYVPSSAAGLALPFSVAVTYDDPYGVQQTASQTVGFYVSTAPASPLYFQAELISLVPGVTNDIPFTLTNQGAELISQIHTIVSAPAQVSVLTLFPTIAELGPNSSVTASIEMYVSDSLANSPLELTFSSSYDNAQGNAASYTQTLGLYTLGSNSSLPSVLISVSPIKTEVGAGTQSMVSFNVKNVGPTPLDSPVFSLSVSSPLVVIRNSSYAVPGGLLKPGATVIYEALVGSSTSATPGFYPASVTVTYVDQSGAESSATFTSGLILSGTIDLVVQSPQVSQGNTTLSVSGEILNEGFSSAYYATVTGSLVGVRGTSEADYVGEIDPNTPVPFSLTVPYTPSGSVRTTNILVNVTFKDSLGLVGTYISPIQTRLTPLSSTSGTGTTTTSSSSGVDLLTYLELGVIAALVIMGVAGFIYIRRNRARLPSYRREEKEDKGVI